jgi:hypothetical protein
MRPYRLLGVGALIGGVIGFAIGHWGVQSGSSTPQTTTTISTTTTTAPAGIEITPSAGPIGTTFTFIARGFRPGTGVRFEVDFPNGHIFKGQSHPVGPDGIAQTTYQATAGNPSGTYQVHATDDAGRATQQQFVVGSAPTTSTPTQTTVAR